MGMSMSTTNNTLEECTNANTKPFAFDGMQVCAKIIDVYDGDTVTAAFDTLGAGIYSHKIRMLGIDTPEIRTKNIKEKEMGLKAREYLKELLINKIVTLHIKSADKYGRILATIFTNDNTNVNEHMISMGHGRTYDGGKREGWFDDNSV